MNDFDRRMREQLLAMASDWHPRATQMKQELRTMFEQRLKRAAMWSWIGSVIGILLMFSGIPALVLGFLLGNASIAVVGAMMFLFGDGWITGSKLLYWTWNSRIRLERDIKEVHADVLDVLDRLERVEAAVAEKARPETG